MEMLVKQYISGGIYLGAPVKTEERVAEKCQLDYRHKRYPKAAHVLDVVRCSILFNDIDNLKNGILKFFQIVENEKSGDIVKIVRFKNGYSSIPNWKCYSDALYADAKANVLFKFKDKTMICEIQFLYTKCQEAKKLSHKFYTVERRLGLMMELQYRLARRKNKDSLSIYLTSLVEEKNWQLLEYELSATPSLIQHFKNSWFNVFDNSSNPAQDCCEKGLKLLFDTVQSESQKAQNSALFKHKFFNEAEISPLMQLVISADDPKLVCCAAISYTVHVSVCLYMLQPFV